MASSPGTLPLEDLQSEISREELYRRRSDRSLIVIDVLPREAYKAGHLPHAVNLPLAELGVHAREVLPVQTAEIAVYCASFT